MIGQVLPKERLLDTYAHALVEAGDNDPNVVVVDRPAAAASLFGKKFPVRYFVESANGTSWLDTSAGLACKGHTVFVQVSAALAAGESYAAIRRSICDPRLNVKILATPGAGSAGPPGPEHPMREDVGILRGLPGMTVVVPADAPSTRAAVLALARAEGPAYLRLMLEELPTVTDGRFEIGRANELRPGSDLTIVALGAMVLRALRVAEELHKVGVEARVLDAASVKPFDEAAVLRGARDTGALLVLEEHTVETGIGSLIAATTAENYPVPVRRVGIPDVFLETPGTEASLDRAGLSEGRILEEAWELLRARGKVP